MEKLQELINKRAEAKLKIEIGKLDSVLKNQFSHILEGIKVDIGTPENPDVRELRWSMSDSNLGRVVFDKNIQRYIDEESKQFLEQVDSIQSQIDELYDNQSNH